MFRFPSFVLLSFDDDSLQITVVDHTIPPAAKERKQILTYIYELYVFIEINMMEMCKKNKRFIEFTTIAF